MTPIKLAILWHQHQPYYRSDHHFVMPWAWLHATKDYLEMAEHFERHPTMRGTINLVPSLLKQLQEYVEGNAVDPVVTLMSKPANTLTASDKSFMLDNFFLAQKEHMIERSTRYHELSDKANGPDRAHFDLQDYRDLAIHFSLAWTGELARGREPFKSLVSKERGYSEQDKQNLANAQLENVKNIVPMHRKLAKKGQIELTTTPFYHPILPLLIDTDCAREAMPEVPLPQNRFRFPEEADEQIRRGREFFKTTVEIEPRGMWPSEGSLSWDALTLIRKHGFAWSATDEAVLANSIGGTPTEAGNLTIKPEHAKYFPWVAKTSEGEIAIFFRDHGLSDNIGFTYQSWNADDAVKHFIGDILNIRSALVTDYGEDVLRQACISVILDGENCWEYYFNNGFDFLDKLYAALTSTPEIQPIAFSEAIAGSQNDAFPHLTKITAGSWIQGNFGIWIGSKEDNTSWDALYAAKKALDEARTKASKLKGDDRSKALAKIEVAHGELMIAEGSDWNWWYGDDNFNAQKNLFDELYRMHLSDVYKKLGRSVPDDLTKTITGRFSTGAPPPQPGAMHRAS
jgi:alpha-amylase/alpha-mannosidase (GH57 family)